MKTTFFFVLFFSITSFGQSNRDIKQQLKTCQDSFQEQQQIIQDLTEQLESDKSNFQITSELLKKLRAENETLRQIMRDYVNQIDDLNMKNIELATELDKCKGN